MSLGASGGAPEVQGRGDLEAAEGGTRDFLDHLEVPRKGKWRGRCAPPSTTHSDYLCGVCTAWLGTLAKSMHVNHACTTIVHDKLACQTIKSAGRTAYETHAGLVIGHISLQAAAPQLGVGRRCGDVLVYPAAVQRGQPGDQGAVLPNARLLLSYPSHRLRWGSLPPTQYHGNVTVTHSNNVVNSHIIEPESVSVSWRCQQC